MLATVLFAISLFSIGCSTGNQGDRLYRNSDPLAPCRYFSDKPYLRMMDSLNPCEAYARVERALIKPIAPYRNIVYPRLPDTTVIATRWGISEDPGIEELAATNLLLCYLYKMGKPVEEWAIVIMWTIPDYLPDRSIVTRIIGDEDTRRFLSDLRTFLGCTDSTYRE
jgi:hypothetical protein